MNLSDWLSFVPIPAWTVVALVTILLFSAFIEMIRPCGASPTVHYKDSTFSRFLLKNVPRFNYPYMPPCWAKHPDVQTLVRIYVMYQGETRFERQFLQMKDRGVIALDWALGEASTFIMRKSRPVIILLPDFMTDARNLAYTCQEAVRQGFQPVVFNRRGHGGSPLTTPRLQSYGDPSDFRQAVKYVRNKLPHGHVTAIGYGAGADLLLAYLGEFGSSAHLATGVAISPLFDPERLYTGFMPQPYELLNLLAGKRLVATHGEGLRRTVDIQQALCSRKLEELEKHIYWKMAGCENAEQYWEKNAPLRDADDISTPVLCIISRDDPLVVDEAIPYDVFQVYPQMLLVTTDYGGHCGFLEWGLEGLRSWADLLALDFVGSVLDFSSKEQRGFKSATR
ncbi:protein ABHD15-like [Limulus polyphemus]|uniref:Protein ABHD15-like n=1 Tax=Limulus polyphemus TaxID=6850 RepID=A0ABM1C4Q5_LIMPO|nr:protein ABHD15-like [Limulus polyphemus]